MTAGQGDVLLVGDAASIHLRRLAHALSAEGLRVGVAGFDPRDYAPEVRTYSLGAHAGVARLAAAVPVLTRTIRRTRPTIVHAHYVSSYGLLAALAVGLVREDRRPALVQTAWGTDLLVTARANAVRRQLAAVALRRADLVTGDSEGLREVAAELAPRVPFHRFVFGPDAALLGGRRLPGQVIVSARRLDPDMRIPRVVDAFLAACETDPTAMAGWRLAIAGDGREREDVLAAARGDGRVRILGSLTPPELHALLLGAHAAVSIPVSDATSVSLLEALAAGAMPIVNDLPANREWVTPGRGIVVSRDPSIEELSLAMIEATGRASNPDALRASVEQVTLEREVGRLVEQFEQVRTIGTLGRTRGSP